MQYLFYRTSIVLVFAIKVVSAGEFLTCNDVAGAVGEEDIDRVLLDDKAGSRLVSRSTVVVRNIVVILTHHSIVYAGADVFERYAERLGIISKDIRSGQIVYRERIDSRIERQVDHPTRSIIGNGADGAIVVVHCRERERRECHTDSLLGVGGEAECGLACCRCNYLSRQFLYEDIVERYIVWRTTYITANTHCIRSRSRYGKICLEALVITIDNSRSR